MRLDAPIVFGTKSKPHEREFVGISRALEPRRVAIKSCAAMTVFGDLSETWSRLIDGHSIDDHTRVPGIRGNRRAYQLAHAVASRCTETSDVDSDAAVVVGTSKGSIEEWLAPPPNDPTSDNAKRGLTTAGLSEIAADLARTLGVRGPVLTVSAACASGMHALIRAALMVRCGEARQVLVVATEASVHPLFLGSFQRLGVLAKTGHGCRPFDVGRAGFYMTEAAAAVLLEAEEAADVRGSEGTSGRAYVERFAFGGDATHMTGGDPNARVLRRLLARVIDDRPVDLIHAHATGTVANDAIELAAIDAVVGNWPRRPVMYSHKAALGHSLGASGLLSVVLNCQAHATGQIPANARTSDPLPAGRVSIPRTTTDRPVRRSVAIAAGFGGPTALVSLAC
jgi:3-oxoacyl-[acyl-carrier-protein] synthase II